MIEIFKYNKKWRINIKNETLQFDDRDEMEETLSELLNLKEEAEPYKKDEKH